MANPKRFSFPLAAAIVLGLGVFVVLTLAARPRRPETVKIGVTFSSQNAWSLGLDWRATYVALLDDLGVRSFRIPVYWNDVERERGKIDWSDFDWMLKEAEARGAEVILAVGRKTPRWPECHEPGWVKALPADEQKRETLRFLEDEIAHFKDFPAVKRWQVENEALFRFGECPPPDRELLKREVEAVRAMDDRPIMITDSGELSTWTRTAPLADVLGISLYRRVNNPVLGDLIWPVTPGFYSVRMALARMAVDEVIVSELQAEPWFWEAVDKTSLDEQYRSMNPDAFRRNIRFARLTGASEIYLWGAEWWYWLKVKRDSGGFWEAARPYFKRE
jgi:hypothetical protein